MLPHPVHRDISPISHQRAISPGAGERVNAETFYDGLIMGLRDYVSRAVVFKIRVQTPSEHLRLRDPSAPFRHARNEHTLCTCLLPLFLSFSSPSRFQARWLSFVPAVKRSDQERNMNTSRRK